jgi:hypothetical protein
MAARAAGSEMLAVLLDAMPEQERTDLINQADRSGITAVFLAFQRCGACPSLRQKSQLLFDLLWCVIDMLLAGATGAGIEHLAALLDVRRSASTADAYVPDAQQDHASS